MRLHAFKAKFVATIEFNCSWIINGVVVKLFRQNTLFLRCLFTIEYSIVHLVYLTVADGTLVNIQHVSYFVQIT